MPKVGIAGLLSKKFLSKIKFLDMKRGFLFFVLLIISYVSLAQIGGLSASKLNTLSATVVGTGKLEFEPSFSVERDIFLVHTNVYDRDTALHKSFNFRFTYGAIPNLELGFYMPVSMNDVALGVKYKVFTRQKVLISVIGGTNLAMDTTVSVNNFGGGLVTSLRYTEAFSSDMELVYLHNNLEPKVSGVFFNMDHGLYIGKIQYVIGFNSMIVPANMQLSQVWITPGVTIENAQQFLIVITYNYSLLKTDIRSQGLSFAFTITLE